MGIRYAYISSRTCTPGAGSTKHGIGMRTQADTFCVCGRGHHEKGHMCGLPTALGSIILRTALGMCRLGLMDKASDF